MELNSERAVAEQEKERQAMQKIRAEIEIVQNRGRRGRECVPDYPSQGGYGQRIPETGCPRRENYSPTGRRDGRVRFRSRRPIPIPGR